MKEPKNILFLASGRGTTFQSFLDYFRLGVLKDISIKALICNHTGAQVIQRARNAEITIFEIEGVTGKKFGSKEEKSSGKISI